MTKTFLPPYEEFEGYVKRIWESGQLTNQGPLLRDFEIQVKKYLDVENFHFVSNGTSALQIALKSLGIVEGEIITTPFTYVATTSAILWEGCRPVFVDIKPETFCIDESKIEAAITTETKAILAVHVFGYPCAVDAIERIARKHSIKVIYDGAHAFGVVYKGRSLLSYGDVSTTSFHATKLFNTIEGGALITNDKKLSDKIDLTKRFGHDGDQHVMLGINAKASEFQAAMGLSNLKYINDIIRSRKNATDLYNSSLDQSIMTLKSVVGLDRNYAYYPVVFKSEAVLLKVITALNKSDIFPRRYFYPSINKISYVNSDANCPVSEEIASKVLCLPLYADMSKEDITRIVNIVNMNA